MPERDRSPPRNYGYLWEKNGGRLPWNTYVDLVIKHTPEMGAAGATDIKSSAAPLDAKKARLALEYLTTQGGTYPNIETMVNKMEGDIALREPMNPKFMSC